MKKCILLRSALLSCALIIQISNAAPIQQNALSGTASNYPMASVDTQQPSQLWELRQMLEQLQNEVRRLRGQLEEKDNELEQLNQELKNGYDDLDQRIELLNKKIDPDTADQTAEDSTQPTVEKTEPAPRSDSTAITSSTKKPPNLAPQTNPNPSNLNSSQLGDKEAYELAYQAYQQGGAAKAIQPMKDFVHQYPNSVYRSHALYWLGEFHLAINPPDFNAAKNYFKIVANRFADSSKAPISLYRLGEISGNIEHNAAESRAYFQHLIQKYPNSSAANRARVTYLP